MLNEFVNDGQPEADSLAFAIIPVVGLFEGVENCVQLIFRNADARIGDGKEQPAQASGLKRLFRSLI